MAKKKAVAKKAPAKKKAVAKKKAAPPSPPPDSEGRFHHSSGSVFWKWYFSEEGGRLSFHKASGGPVVSLEVELPVPADEAHCVVAGERRGAKLHGNKVCLRTEAAEGDLFVQWAKPGSEVSVNFWEA